MIRAMKSRKIRWAVHVARIEKRRNSYATLVGKFEGKSPLGRHRRRYVDGRLILEWILGKQGG
jgi:hypothetical protein